MALAQAMQWEVRTAGSDTACSGGFVAGASGTDYSQQNAAQYSGTNLVIDGAVNTKCTSATHNFVAADVGNTLRVTAGSGFTVGVFEIVSVAANAATVDRSLGTLGSTNGTFAVGGALATPGIACSLAVDHNIVWIKSGTYSITSTTSNIAGGRLAQANATCLRGYQTARGDDAARPVLQASGIATTTIVTLPADQSEVWNVEVDGAGLTAIKGFDINAGKAYFCVARNCTNNGFTGDQAIRCRATACTTQPAFNVPAAKFCVADVNTAGGFLNTNGHGMIGCIAYGNTTYGFSLSGAVQTITNCTAYNNSTAGFTYGSQEVKAFINCVAYGNGTYGFDAGSAGPFFFMVMLNCAAGANTTADRRGTPAIDTFITLTADPFTNKAGGDFSLNNNAGGGAALRGLGLPGVFPDGLTTSYDDIGAAQHQDSGGAVTSYIRQVAMRGGGG